MKEDDNSYISEVETVGGWEIFFNSQRSSIVFAVLGKVLEVHVFGHEMFGSSDAQLKALRSLDLEMINLDGVFFSIALKNSLFLFFILKIFYIKKSQNPRLMIFLSRICSPG